jgi:hypothetical protein
MRDRVKKLVLLPVVTLAIAGIMASCSNLNDLVPRPDVETGKTKAFLVSGLSIDPTEVSARDEVVITAHVTNVTTVDDTYNAELKINDATEASDQVLVPAGKTQTLTFAIFKNIPGTYKVSLGALEGQFSVAETIATGPVNQLPAVSAQSVPSCCGVGGQVSPEPQTGASCCGTGVQNNATTQPGRTSGCSCGR